MLNDKELELIERLASTIGQSSGEVVTAYAWWHATDSIAWILGAIALLVMLFRWKPDIESHAWEMINPVIVKAIAITICVFIVAGNVATVANPKARAINQLINDIRGD